MFLHNKVGPHVKIQNFSQLSINFGVHNDWILSFWQTSIWKQRSLICQQSQQQYDSKQQNFSWTKLWYWDMYEKGITGKVIFQI